MWVFSMPGTLDDEGADWDLLWTAGASGLEQRAGVVRAYFENEVELPVRGEWSREREQDWQQAWKQDLRPVTAGRLTVAPPWLRDEVPPGQMPLVIEVGMAFGTGHHATTQLALEALQDLDLVGARLLDVGSGSGVLALGASLLGAGLAVGVDTDPVTLPAARENAELNGLEEGETLTFLEGTLEDARGLYGEAAFQVVVANLYAELHDTLMSQYRGVLRDGGFLVLTGILEGKLSLVLTALERECFRDVQTRTRGEWALIRARA